jgi:hypothetical protein
VREEHASGVCGKPHPPPREGGMKSQTHPDRNRRKGKLHKTIGPCGVITKIASKRKSWGPSESERPEPCDMRRFGQNHIYIYIYIYSLVWIT